MKHAGRQAAAERKVLWVAMVVVAATSGLGGCSANNANEISPPEPQTFTATPSGTPSPSAADNTSWTTYKSKRYDIKIGYPSDWTVEAASRGWKSEADIDDTRSNAHEAFLAPAGNVRVSVWSMPLDHGKEIGSIADVETWAENYCKASGNSPCTGIGERAVELCIEKWDCHPALLVPFKSDVQAFLSAGIYESESMTVVSVWRPESHPAVAPYGGAQALLERFLAKMQVWPAATPRDERR